MGKKGGEEKYNDIYSAVTHRERVKQGREVLG